MEEDDTCVFYFLKEEDNQCLEADVDFKGNHVVWVSISRGVS